MVEPNLLLTKLEKKMVEDLAQPFSKVEKVEKVDIISYNNILKLYIVSRIITIYKT